VRDTSIYLDRLEAEEATSAYRTALVIYKCHAARCAFEIRDLGLTIVSHPGTGWDGSIWPRSLDTGHVLSFGSGLSSHSPWAGLGVSEARFPAFRSLISSCTQRGRRPYPAAKYQHIDFASVRSTIILRNTYDNRLTWITGKLDYLAGWGK
jgi:hypothetical protein